VNAASHAASAWVNLRLSLTPPSAVARPLGPREHLTKVELIWIEQRLEHWIRFGRHSAEQIVTGCTRVLSFRPDAVFALVRWTAHDLGIVHSRIDVVRAVKGHEPCTALPFVRPGGRSTFR
jgi:hypothetical protein